MHPSVLKTIIEICLLRATPDDLPSTFAIRNIAFGVYFLMCMVIGAENYEGANVISYAATQVVFLVLVVFAVLSVQKQGIRFTQTVSALAFTDALVGFLAWPVLRWGMLAQESGQSVQIPSILSLVLIAWSFVISVHIFRHALSIRLSASVLVNVAVMVFSYFVNTSLFPVAS